MIIALTGWLMIITLTSIFPGPNSNSRSGIKLKQLPNTATYGPTQPAVPRIVWSLKFISAFRFVLASMFICWLWTAWHCNLSKTGGSSKNFIRSKNRLPTSAVPSLSMRYCGWLAKFNMIQHDPSYHEFEIHGQRHHHEQYIARCLVVCGLIICGVHHSWLLPSSGLSKFGFIFFW